jgi:hypothetical protein
LVFKLEMCLFLKLRRVCTQTELAPTWTSQFWPEDSVGKNSPQLSENSVSAGITTASNERPAAALWPNEEL